MKKDLLIKIASVVALLGLLIVLILVKSGAFSSGGKSGNSDASYSGNALVMDTLFTGTVTIKENNKDISGEDLWKAVIGLGTEMEQEMLSYHVENSELALINASAGAAEGFELSAEMEEILTLCLEVSERSGGAFDITVGRVSQLWDFNDENHVGEIPDEADIKEAVEKSGYEKVRIENHRIYLPEGMSLDLGAVGKGIYLDGAYELFLEQAESSVMAAGGSILTFGSKADGSTWNVGITDPFDTSKTVEVLHLNGSFCVSTSGDYERYIQVGDERYHHILDPNTGYPADSGLASVTILLPADGEKHNGLLTDALSTAVFVLGKDEGIKLADEYGAGVMVVDVDGNISMNEGMESFAE